MSIVIPSFWPAVDQDGLRLAPLKRGQSWLAILKVDPELRPLNPREEETVLRLGFQKGQNGRYIMPGIPTEAGMQSLATLFGGEVAPLDPAKAVFLESAERLEPPIPDALRQGIAWWWGNNRQRMIIEIRHSIRRSNDEEAKSLLSDIPANQWRNPSQLRVWIDQAFSGEVTPITEPILGMGLAKAAQLYGGELPDDLERWRQVLAEYRGEPQPETTHLSPAAQFIEDATANSRPPIGTRVTWSDQKGYQTGRVVRHSDEHSDSLWVASDEPKFINGLPLPAQARISIDQLIQNPAARPEVAAQATPSESGRAVATTQRWVIGIDDIPNKSVRELHDSNRLNEEARDMIRSALHVKALVGENPILVEPETKLQRIVHRWGAVGEYLGDSLGQEDTPETHEALAIIRDTLLEQFNEVQPELQTDNPKPTLAVIPIPVSDRGQFSAYREKENRPALLKQMVYRIGLHPLAALELRDEFRNRMGRIDPATDMSTYDEASYAVFHSYLSIPGLNFNRLATGIIQTELPYQDYQHWMQAQDSDFPEAAIDELSNGSLSLDPAVMQKRLAAVHLDKSLLSERLLDSNTATLNSIATLAGISRHSLEKLDHPLFVLADILETRGVMQGWSRAEQLTGLGLDMRNDFKTIGQMATMAGARLVQIHEEKLIEEVALDHGIKLGHRAVVASGFIVNEDGHRAFTVGVASTDKVLDESESHHSYFTFNETSPGQKADEALGKIVALGAIQPLRFSDVLPEGVLTQKAMNELDPTWYTVPAVSKTRFYGLPYQRNAGHEPLGLVQTNGLSAPQLPETEGENALGLRDLMDAAGKTQKGLQTLTEAWRKNQDQINQVKAALKLWVAEHKHTKKLLEGGQKVVADAMFNKLIEPATEMVVLGTRNTSRSIRHTTWGVSTREIRDAGFDRNIAAELTIAGVSVPRGFYVQTFDAMAALKPEALRQLNELKAEEEIRRSQDTKASDDKEIATPRGARQNRGLVAGLSVKDMRGNASVVLSNLASASADDQEKMTRKTRLWAAPDWVNLRNPQDAGEKAMAPMVAQFWSLFRKEMPSKSPANVPAFNEVYARYVLAVRDLFDQTRTVEQLEALIKKDGELYELINEVLADVRELKVHPQSFLGDSLTVGVDFGLRAFYRRARNGTNQNETWPSELGRSRQAAANRGEQFGAMPALKKLVRSGEDYRKGLDTDEEALIRTFGFSGVEYGESMPQRERTEYLNHAYDGFMDLARVLNVDPQALSLSGSLGLAFGSRGRGGRRAALAHFEPANNVINLTRLKGAGSMAHEYGHALANYFHRMISGQVRGPGDLSEAIGGQRHISEMKGETVGQLRKPIYDAFALIMSSILYKASVDDDGKPELALEAFDQSRENRTDLVKDATWADNDRRTDNGYWATPHELFARSFEAWVNYRLDQNTDGKFRNDFLVRPDKLEAWGIPMAEQEAPEVGSKRPQLYPSGEHLKLLDQAFERLIKEVRVGTKPVKHEHLGEIDLPYMYSYDTGSIERLSEIEMSAIAQSVIGEVARMCGDQVEVRWEKELRDDTSSLVAGRFSVIEGSPEKPGHGIRGLIELAYGAPSSTAYHEAFHFAQAALLTPQEQQVLDHEFSIGQPLHDRLIQTLADQGKHEVIAQSQDTREAQAYAYQEWVKGNLDLKVEEQPRTFFGQISDFCKKILGIGKDSGFTEPHQLFTAFYDGRLAARQNLQASIQEAQDLARQEQDQALQNETFSDEGEAQLVINAKGNASAVTNEILDEEDGALFRPS